MEYASQSALPSLGPRRWRLAYHLAVVLAVKLVLLALLWNIFIKPNRVTVDVGAMSQRIAGAVSPAPAASSVPSAPSASSGASSNGSTVSPPTSPGDHK
ncbi:MAG: hypothetical protein LBE85_11120 [Candidatus Accumulibacter sp.]|jgi:cytoskeletal protein RodZ|nr:hypothetical protein [Accumulibacter sp.]